MEGKYLKYKVFNKGGLKVGVFGVGIELEGLVPKKLYAIHISKPYREKQIIILII